MVHRCHFWWLPPIKIMSCKHNRLTHQLFNHYRVSRAVEPTVSDTNAFNRWIERYTRKMNAGALICLLLSNKSNQLCSYALMMGLSFYRKKFAASDDRRERKISTECRYFGRHAIIWMHYTGKVPQPWHHSRHNSCGWKNSNGSGRKCTKHLRTSQIR